jgi:hypothetical protein
MFAVLLLIMTSKAAVIAGIITAIVKYLNEKLVFVVKT